MDEELEKTIKEYEEYAKSKGFKLNPNKQIVEAMVKALLAKEKALGKRYCPCRKTSTNEKENKRIICPCFYHLEEIENQGHCFCNLFVKNNE